MSNELTPEDWERRLEGAVAQAIDVLAAIAKVLGALPIPIEVPVLAYLDEAQEILGYAVDNLLDEEPIPELVRVTLIAGLVNWLTAVDMIAICSRYPARWRFAVIVTQLILGRAKAGEAYMMIVEGDAD